MRVVSVLWMRCFFFFQAEDGIRDATVTGVQTCALPIYGILRNSGDPPFCPGRMLLRTLASIMFCALCGPFAFAAPDDRPAPAHEIGRASCRERAEARVCAAPGKRREHQVAVEVKRRSTM